MYRYIIDRYIGLISIIKLKTAPEQIMKLSIGHYLTSEIKGMVCHLTPT